MAYSDLMQHIMIIGNQLCGCMSADSFVAGALQVSRGKPTGDAAEFEALRCMVGMLPVNPIEACQELIGLACDHADTAARTTLFEGIEYASSLATPPQADKALLYILRHPTPTLAAVVHTDNVVWPNDDGSETLNSDEAALLALFQSVIDLDYVEGSTPDPEDALRHLEHMRAAQANEDQEADTQDKDEANEEETDNGIDDLLSDLMQAFGQNEESNPDENAIPQQEAPQRPETTEPTFEDMLAQLVQKQDEQKQNNVDTTVTEDTLSTQDPVEQPEEQDNQEEEEDAIARRIEESRRQLRSMMDDILGLNGTDEEEPKPQKTPSQKPEEQPRVQEDEKAEESHSSLRTLMDILGLNDEEDKAEEKKEAEEETNTGVTPTGMKKLESLTRAVKKAQAELLKVVFGQDQAINAFISGFFQAELITMTHKEHKGPKATFLFAGPPGVGKTFLADNAARVLNKPYKRFDMSEYSEKEANLQFAGSDKVYKNGHAGNVTSFVAEHPDSILLFDEIEKAHINVIHLFLQIMEAGRLRDNFTETEVDFGNTVLIFTTNVGRKLYENPDIEQLSSVPRKQVLEALVAERDGQGAPLFPSAIVSRFSSGNVLMFNRMEAHTLLRVAQNEFDHYAEALGKNTGISITYDPNVLPSLLYAEIAKVDARSIRGRAANFFSQELFELLRLLTGDARPDGMKRLRHIHMGVELPQDEQIRVLYATLDNPHVLVFGTNDEMLRALQGVKGLTVHSAGDMQTAKNILFDNNITAIFCDVRSGAKDTRTDILNIEDLDSDGVAFFNYAVENLHIPTYVFTLNQSDISSEEELSFLRMGARGIVYAQGDDDYDLGGTLLYKCNIAHQQNKLLELAKANMILSFQTAQTISADGTEATISLFGLALSLAPASDDSQHLLSGVSKPTVRFADVIGSDDAKGELTYFINYFKDPMSFVRRGVRAPKGILLYGPPGTGKTLLAKAMAGESDVTFICAEGNEFLRSLVGEGAQKVHDYFALARRYAPAILFIDEIDAIGKNRNNSSARNTADVLTAFLTEMDGFRTQADKPVFVLAATNVDLTEKGDSEGLDPALLRRFDRRILIDLPTKPQREQFIRYKIAKVSLLHLSEEQIVNIAVRSTGMSLADLDSVFELAMRNAIKSRNNEVDDACFVEAFEQYNYGDVKRWSDEALLRTARHEAGHALMCWLCGDTPSFLTVVSRGNFGGYMENADIEDKGTYTRDELLGRIRVSLGGRAAELEYYGEDAGMTTGASSDLQHATGTALAMLCRFGMDPTLGMATFGLDSADPQYAAQIRARVNEILKEQLAQARNLIDRNRKAIDAIVDALLAQNQLKGPEIDAIFRENAIR